MKERGVVGGGGTGRAQLPSQQHESAADVEPQGQRIRALTVIACHVGACICSSEDDHCACTEEEVTTANGRSSAILVGNCGGNEQQQGGGHEDQQQPSLNKVVTKKDVE